MDKLSERLAVVATVDPDAYTSGVNNTDYVDMTAFNEAIFVAMLGTGVTGVSLNLKLQEDKSAGTGTGAQDLTGKAITALTTGSNDGQSVIHVRANDLSQGYTHVRAQMLASGAGADAGVIGIAGAPRFHPASDYDLASVAEIVD